MAAYVTKNDKGVLPKSQEDGKLSKTQRLTHTDILAIGHKIFQKNNENQRESFNEEIAKLKDQLLKQAMEEKELALKEAEKNAAEAMKKAMADAQALQEAMVKEEARRVKEVMKHIAAVRIEQERKDGEERMKTVLKQQREDFDVEKHDAILSARAEEQDKAVKMLEDLTRQHEENFERLKQEGEEKKQDALKNLEKRMTMEKDNAVLETKTLILEEARSEKDEMNKKHKEEIEQKSREVAEKDSHINDLLQEIKREQDLHMETKDRMHFVLNSFQNFIDSQPGFSKGQADYLLKDFLVSQ